ncbi:Phage integrase family protein [Roseovarius sp. THAF27]|uniref:hypothetical protein n=1 Tax=Roseovarius sp. THAF27 TaxID=2587850 RepID=UPI00126952F6|nr:hypothetical protein [Roseovarius sp. THAF27]QFT81938.1 Phage integrase family protein [Roseovarius sp. THAF27]
MKHLWKRGGTYWFRMRRPKRFEKVHPPAYLTQPLGTDSKSQALTLIPAIKQQWLAELEARLAGSASTSSKEAYDATLALLKTHNLRPLPAEHLAQASIHDILDRLNQAERLDPSGTSNEFASFMGGIELPDTSVSTLAGKMDRILEPEVRAKNNRQRRVWSAKWLRSSKVFNESVGDKPIVEVTKNDAYSVRRYWQKIVETGRVETGYANKHLGYLKRMIDAFYADLEIDEFENPFDGVRIARKQPWESKQSESRKPEFSPLWIKETIIGSDAMSGLNEEARDIVIICAETGCREAEIFDLPENSILLDADVPHIWIRVEMPDHESDPQANHVSRDIKTGASIRRVPLLGAALDAMRRHPEGFPRFRGNANYYNTVNKYFRDNGLFPSAQHTIGGLRHSYESRMRRLGIDNEERAQLMGHSLRKVRGREIYGDQTDLRLRALYAEMIAFPTSSWQPRSYDKLSSRIDEILEAEGFKLKS